MPVQQRERDIVSIYSPKNEIKIEFEISLKGSSTCLKYMQHTKLKKSRVGFEIRENSYCELV